MTTPTASSYAATKRGGGDPNARLHTINTTDGTTQLVGFLGINSFQLGLAYDEGTQTMFLNVGDPLNALYTVDVKTGAATLVGPNGIVGGGINGLAMESACFACPWDCRRPGDGLVGISDFLLLLALWGGPGSCDFDGGGVGISDFLALLANWGPCP